MGESAASRGLFPKKYTETVTKKKEKKNKCPAICEMKRGEDVMIRRCQIKKIKTISSTKEKNRKKKGKREDKENEMQSNEQIICLKQTKPQSMYTICLTL